MIELTTTTGHSRVGYLSEYSLVLDAFKPIFNNDFQEFVIANTRLIMNNKQKSNGNCSCKMKDWSKEHINSKYAAKLLELCSLSESADNVIVSMLLTDGHVYENGSNIEIVYKGINNELHQVFAALIYKKYGILPNTFFKGYNEHGTIVYRTIFRNKGLLKNLKEKSSHFRTSPMGMNKDEFLKCCKPTIKNCFSENMEIKKSILQLAMAAEGYVCPTFDRNFRITVGFACSHPALLKEWKSLFKEFDINMIVKKQTKGWSGSTGLYISDIREIRKFHKNIGFTPTITIKQNGFYEGYKKQEILEKSIKYHEYLSYKFRVEGTPIKNYKNRWREDFKRFIHNEISYEKSEKIKFERIFSSLENIEKRISPHKFLKVIAYLENKGNLDNKTFRKITRLNGIYSWSRCRQALKSYYKSDTSEHKDWRSYTIKLIGGKQCD